MLNLLILAYLIAVFLSDLIRLILHTLLKSDTSTPKSITNSPSIGEILYQSIAGAWWEFMVAIDYLMTIPGCDWLLINQLIAGALVERLACRTHWSGSGNSPLLLACLPVSMSDLILRRGRPHRRLWLIRIVPYSRSLAVDLDGGYLGASLGGLDSIRFGSGPILRLWFNSTDRLIESFVVFAGWLPELSSSGSSNGRLVLATVVWFWRRSSGSVWF